MPETLPLRTARTRYQAALRSARAAEKTLEARRAAELAKPDPSLPEHELDAAEEQYDLRLEALREEVGLPPRQRALAAAEDVLIDSWLACLKRGAAIDPSLRTRLEEVEPVIASARRRLGPRAQLVAAALANTLPEDLA